MLKIYQNYISLSVDIDNFKVYKDNVVTSCGHLHCNYFY